MASIALHFGAYILLLRPLTDQQRTAMDCSREDPPNSLQSPDTSTHAQPDDSCDSHRNRIY